MQQMRQFYFAFLTMWTEYKNNDSGYCVRPFSVNVTESFGIHFHCLLLIGWHGWHGPLIGPGSLYIQTPVRWPGVLGIIILLRASSDAGEYATKVQILESLRPNVICSEHGLSSSDGSRGLKFEVKTLINMRNGMSECVLWFSPFALWDTSQVVINQWWV